jgi:hypothetical protein
MVLMEGGQTIVLWKLLSDHESCVYGGVILDIHWQLGSMDMLIQHASYFHVNWEEEEHGA